jgi:hypothetical protein
MHINTINSLFVDMGIDVDSKGLNFENVPDIYQDVEVKDNMSQYLANFHIEENYVSSLNDT